MRSNKPIKPCPFCGFTSSIEKIPKGLSFEGFYVVGCDTDGCLGNINHFTMIFASEENAKEAWNKRSG